MKGNEKIIEHLNARLAEELTAINQYFVHAEMCENWGYDKLHAMIRARAITEMKHAERLIGRILFLEGRPTVSQLNKIDIGAQVDEQLAKDWAAEATAVRDYNADVRAAAGRGYRVGGGPSGPPASVDTGTETHILRAFFLVATGLNERVQEFVDHHDFSHGAIRAFSASPVT